MMLMANSPLPCPFTSHILRVLRVLFLMFLQGAFEATVCACRSGKAVMRRTVVDELRNHNDVVLDGVSLLSCPLHVSFACAGGGFARMRERPLEELSMLDS
jgi:hypothetical protein